MVRDVVRRRLARMLMNLIDFRLPATGFASPLVLWTACHERGQRMAQLLSRLLEHWTAEGPSEHVNVTAVDVRRYFDEAAPRHHQDEDVDLFPRLLRRLDISGTTESDRLSDLIKRLDTEHREMETLWPATRAATILASKARTSRRISASRPSSKRCSPCTGMKAWRASVASGSTTRCGAARQRTLPACIKCLGVITCRAAAITCGPWFKV